MKKTLGEVGKRRSLADIDLNKIKPTNVVLSLEEGLKDSKRLMTLFFNNEFEKAIEGIQYYSETSMLHSVALGTIRFLQMMLTMSKKQMDETGVALKKTIQKIDALRYQRSYKNYLLSPDYNNFADIQCHAEISFVMMNLVYGMLIALRDQSVLGIINAGYKINLAFRALNECKSIQKSKNNWVSEDAKANFEGMCDMSQGSFEIVLSMFPAKLAKLLEYIGFSCNQQHALTLMHKSCTTPDVLSYHVSSLVICVYHGLIEYVYCLGDKNLEVLEGFKNTWKIKCPSGAFTHLIIGITELNKGNIDSAVTSFYKIINEQDYWPQLHFIAHFLLVICYSMTENYEKGEESARVLRDQCKWSSSLFYFIHSVFLLKLSRKKDEEEKKQIEKQINEQLKLVPTLKRKLGGIHVFHEELSINKSKRYYEKLDDWISPFFELHYFWNFYYLMREKKELLDAKLNIANEELKKLKKDKNGNYVNVEVYYYLLFYRAVITRHMNQSENAENIFRDIIKKEKELKQNSHLIPLSYFEIGLIKYDQGNLKESKKNMKKAKSYGNYFGENLISFRIDLLMEKMKNQKKLQKSKQ